MEVSEERSEAEALQTFSSLAMIVRMHRD